MPLPSATYPAGIVATPGEVDTSYDNGGTYAVPGSNVPGAYLNQLAVEIRAVQTELGTDPAGSLTNVKTRLAVCLNDDGTFKGTLSSTFVTSGVISPAQLTAQTDDWAPTGLSSASVIRVDTDASRDLTGLTGGSAGRVIFLHNVGAFDLVLKDESASSTAANRFALTGDLTVAADGFVVLQYDGTSTRWRAVSGGSGISGGTANFVTKYASATSLAVSAYGDDGTYGTFMGIGSSTFNDASTLLKWRGTTVPASYTHGSAGGTDIYFRAQSAFATSGGNGANIYFMPGSADGAGTAGRFRVCLAGDATKYVDIYKDAFGNAFYVNSESGGYTLFKIGGTTVFAIAQNITTSAADAAQGAFGFWTDKSYFLGAAGSSSDITLGRKSANVLRLTAGAETDASTGLAIGANSTPAAYTNSSDATGKYAVFRAQSGGTHTASNPDGGGFSFILGAKGSGGSGSMGQFRIYESSAGDYAYFTYSSGSHMYLGTSSGKSLIISPNSSLVCRDAALATSAAEGDLYIPSSAGKPTGTPTTYTGTAPIRADTTNNVVWAYLNSQWAQIGGAANLLTSAEQRTFGAGFVVSTLTTTADTAYWVYMGYTLKPITIKHVEVRVTTIGAGAQTAEVALASSASPPNKGNQTLTKLTADGTVDDLTTTGVKRNTSSFNYACAAGVHLWAGIRTNMATTQPTFRSIGEDYGAGNYCTTATAGALTGAGPWTGTVSSAAGTAAPMLKVVMD